MSDNPPAFHHRFQPAEQLNQEHLGLFEQYLPRQEKETDEAYARRLGGLGLCEVVTSEETRDIPRYRKALTDADQKKVPLVLIAAERPNLTDSALEERPPIDMIAFRRQAALRDQDPGLNSPINPK